MPRVGSKTYAYTPKGEAQAKAEAKRTGQKVEMTKKGTVRGKK